MFFFARRITKCKAQEKFFERFFSRIFLRLVLTSEAIEMENLPLLCLKKVFEYLPNLNEQIRCSLACQKWRATFQLFKSETLCLYADNHLPTNKRLAYTNDRFTSSNSFSVSWFEEFLASEITRSYFAHIKKLAFYKYSDSNICDCNKMLPKFEFARQLNHFRELEYLEMENDRKFVYYLQDRIIDLPKLRVLSLDRPFTSKARYMGHQNEAGFDNCPIFLNTPQLTTFKGRLSDFKFLFPKQLRHLDLEVHLECLPIFFEQTFPNLKCLILNLVDKFPFDSYQKFVSVELFVQRIVIDEMLRSLPNLKILVGRIRHIKHCDVFYDRPSPTRFVELNRKDMQALVLLDKFLDFQNSWAYTKFFGQIDHLTDSVHVSSQSELECKIPANHFGGYLQLASLNIGWNPVDPSLLLKLLRCIRYVDSVKIDARELEQNFFDRLPDCLSGKSLHLPPLEICDFKFLRRLAFRSIYFTVHKEPFSYDRIFNILKNELCHQISFTDLISRNYKKKRSHKSLFKDFDCSKCKQSFGEGDSKDEVERHVDEHLATENVYSEPGPWPYFLFRPTPFG